MRYREVDLLKEVAPMAFEQLYEDLETMYASEKMYTLDDLHWLMPSWGYKDAGFYGAKSTKNKLEDHYGDYMFFAKVKVRKIC